MHIYGSLNYTQKFLANTCNRIGVNPRKHDTDPQNLPFPALLSDRLITQILLLCFTLFISSSRLQSVMVGPMAEPC